MQLLFVPCVSSDFHFSAHRDSPLISEQNTNQTRDTNDSPPNHVENQSHSHSFQQTENTQPNFETTNEKSKETEPNIPLENQELPSDQPKGQPMTTRSKV